MSLRGPGKVTLAETTKCRLQGDALRVILGPWLWLSPQGGGVFILAPLLTPVIEHFVALIRKSQRLKSGIAGPQDLSIANYLTIQTQVVSEWYV